MAAAAWALGRPGGTDLSVGGLAAALIVGLAVWTLLRAYPTIRYGSYWQAGSISVGAGVGLVSSVFLPFSAVPLAAAGMVLAGRLSPGRLARLLWRTTGVVAFAPYSLGYRKLRAYRSTGLTIRAYREAVSRGDLRAIFGTAASLAEVLWDVGRGAELPSLLEPVIALAKEEQAIPQQARLSQLCAMALAYQGEYPRGAALLTQSYRKSAAARDEEVEATRRQAQRTPLGQPVLTVRPRTLLLRSQIVDLTNSLMAIHQEMGAFSESMAWGREAIKEAEVLAAIEEEFPLELRHLHKLDPTVVVRLNLADLILDADLDPGDARPHILAARKALQWSRDLHQNEQALLHLVEAKLLLRTGQPCSESVRQNLLTSARFYLAAGNLKFGAETLLWVAVMEARDGNSAASKAILEEANAVDDRCLRAVFPVCSDETKIAFVASIRRRTDAFLALILDHFRDDPTARGSAFDLCMRRKGLTTAVQAERTALVLSGRYPELASLLEEHTAICRELARLASGAGGATDARKVATLGERRRQLETELSRSIPEMRLSALSETADRKAISTALKHDQVLIEFVRFRPFRFEAAHPEPQWGKDRYLAFVVGPSAAEAVAMIDVGDADAIDQLIADFRAEITGEAETRGMPTAAEGGDQAHPGAATGSGGRLRAAVFDPLLAAIGDRTRLLLAPDGDLTRLPFEVLPAAVERQLIDDFQVSYVAVGHDVLRFDGPGSRQPAESVIVADPDFDLRVGPADATVEWRSESAGARASRDLDGSSLRFSRLSATEVEGNLIGAHLRVSPWLQKGALEARIKACRSPLILHIATHGFFLQDQESRRSTAAESAAAPSALAGDGQLGQARAWLENPLLRSGLALAGANTRLTSGPLPDEAEDGILTAEDVAGLDLAGTELVVLSACETGLGEVRTGEGVFGLRRAFVLAGARALVMSLWKVPDRQTQELMVEFYDRLLGGEPCADALRGAQLTIRSKYPHPLYWGAFVCQGDPGLVTRAADRPAARRGARARN